MKRVEGPVVAVQVSPSATAQGRLVRLYPNGMATVDAGGELITGTWIRNGDPAADRETSKVLTMAMKATGRKAERGWARWYAWHPVYATDAGRWVWLRRVWRRQIREWSPIDATWIVSADYRLHGVEGDR